MKTIPLTQGQVALVDDADYDAVNAHKWFALKKGHHFYAVREIRKPDGGRTIQYMHCFLMPGIPQTDHHDGNGLNNQRNSNLRPATHRQNQHGFRHKKFNATSKYRGVSRHKQTGKWAAEIFVDGKKLFLGLFTDEEDAARAFDAAARRYRGKFAHLNFP